MVNFLKMFMSLFLGWENPNLCTFCLGVSGESIKFSLTTFYLIFINISTNITITSVAFLFGQIFFVTFCYLLLCSNGKTNASLGIQLSFVGSLRFQFLKAFFGDLTSSSMRCKPSAHRYWLKYLHKFRKSYT